MSNETSSGSWVVVELFGHQKVAGYAERDERYGPVMTRVDIPETPGIPAHSSFFGDKAIYAIHPVAEEVARATAADLQHRPIIVFSPELVDRKAYYDMRARLDGRLLDAPDADDGDEEDF